MICKSSLVFYKWYTVLLIHGFMSHHLISCRITSHNVPSHPISSDQVISRHHESVIAM